MLKSHETVKNLAVDKDHKCTLRPSFLSDSPFLKHINCSCSWMFHKCDGFSDSCTMDLILQIFYIQNPSNHTFFLSVYKEWSIILYHEQSFLFVKA